MEGVVVDVRVRRPCKQFAIKDNGICDRSARGLDGHKAKLHSFFPLRTIRVVTRVLDCRLIRSSRRRNAENHSDLQ